MGTTSKIAVSSLHRYTDIGWYNLSASKRVSEIHTEQARKLGLPAIIIRPGTVTGHSVTGALNMNDYTNKFLASIVQLQAYPDVDVVMDMAPGTPFVLLFNA